MNSTSLYSPVSETIDTVSGPAVIVHVAFSKMPNVRAASPGSKPVTGVKEFGGWDVTDARNGVHLEDVVRVVGPEGAQGFALLLLGLARVLRPYPPHA